jgi:hypothetical protein
MSLFDSSAPAITVLCDVPFPANVVAGPGIEVDRSDPTAWLVGLDYLPLGENVAPVPSSNYYAAVYDQSSGAYEKVRLDNLVAVATAGLDARTPVGDANYLTVSTDRYVGLTAQLTVNRTITLMAASSAAGRELVLQDEVGGLSSAHYWIINPTGTDTINGLAALVLSTKYGGVRLRSNGSNAWNVIAATGVTPISDASYTCNSNDHVVTYTTLAAARTVTLPAASSYAPGQRLVVMDQSGNCSATLTISIVPAGADLISGSSAPVILQQAYDFRGLISDGVAHWTIVDTSQGAGGSGGTIHSTDIVDSSPLGRQLLTNAAASADRTALGSGTTGDVLFQATSPGSARTTLGSTTVGDAVFVAASQAAAQTALGLGTGATMPATQVGSTAPASPVVGELWFDTNGGQMYVWYNDGTSSQWVPVANLNVAGIYLPLTGGTLSGPLTAQAVSMTSLNGGQLAGMRNLVINGDMRIDQRNNGAAVIPTATSYVIDRWAAAVTTASLLSFQRVADSPGFSGSAYTLQSTTKVTHTIAPADNFALYHCIEALNMAHLQWGTSNALPVTVSFTVVAGVAGSLSVALRNGAQNRSYVTTVPVTTTSTRVSFTVPGDTAGTWATDNTAGIFLAFDLGAGANYNAAAANVWAAGQFGRLATQTLNLVSSAVNTQLNIKDVQIEMGSVATPFERRPIGTELALCQRYYQRFTGSLASVRLTGYQLASGSITTTLLFPAMRIAPASTIIGTWTTTNCSTFGVANNGTGNITFSAQATATGGVDVYSPANGGFDLSAEL